jgi:hypothetical protein
LFISQYATLHAGATMVFMRKNHRIMNEHAVIYLPVAQDSESASAESKAIDRLARCIEAVLDRKARLVEFYIDFATSQERLSLPELLRMFDRLNTPFEDIDLVITDNLEDMRLDGHQCAVLDQRIRSCGARLVVLDEAQNLAA